MKPAELDAGTPTTLDEACNADRVVLHLVRAMRDRPPRRLDEAIDEVRESGVPEGRIANAVATITRLQEGIRRAKEPASIVTEGRETWYPGPREHDQNWGDLRALLREEGWDPESLDALDKASTKIVASLPNPARAEEFHSVGLVLGYVQSGKTTNFTSVMAKAADAGYKLFIVLSGIHDGLRQQTQDRLNAQLWERNSDLWHRLTDAGDFRPTANVDALIASHDRQSILAVVKKNGPRLRALRNWLKGARPELLAHCPVLIIDDEADQASVNTAKPDRDPSMINRLIREIVDVLPQAAYVGYTATPFANVLIDPARSTDLYPRDFIIDLPRPSAYIGPETIFGREPLEFDADGIEEQGLDVIRSVPVDELDWLRPKGAAARRSFEPAVTPSLEDAIRYFLLSTAARRVRGGGNRHATMLVHNSQYTNVHRVTADAIRGELHSIRNLLARNDRGLAASFSELWSRECKRVAAADFGLREVVWSDVFAALPYVVSDASVVIDNATSTDRLSYLKDHPRVVIAVGGNTLSRGLTLEGLSVSFFVRTASAYDTLLQMGRWFGYRHGYADLTRIWMPDELRQWFYHLATVEQEIRIDIARYEVDGVTPRGLGPRIRTHPKLAITAAAKMQAAVDASVSYSGRRIQTILFNHRDRAWLGENLDATRWLVEQTGDAARVPPKASGKSGVTVIGPIPSSLVVEFLRRYRFHEASRDLNGSALRTYIQERVADGELTHFKIAIMARARIDEGLGVVDLGLGVPVAAINRARMADMGAPGYANIKALMSLSDRVVDLPVATKELSGMSAAQVSALRNFSQGRGCGDGTGLLAIYPISAQSRPIRGRNRTELDAVDDVIGIGLVFPESRVAASVGYKTADLSGEPVEEADDIDPDEVGAPQ